MTDQLRQKAWEDAQAFGKEVLTVYKQGKQQREAMAEKLQDQRRQKAWEDAQSFGKEVLSIYKQGKQQREAETEKKQNQRKTEKEKPQVKEPKPSAAAQRQAKKVIEPFTAISLAQPKQLQGILDAGPFATLHIIQGRSHLPLLTAGSLSLDNLSTEELMASRTISSNKPAYNKGSGNWHTFLQANAIKGSWRQQRNISGQSFSGFGLTTGLFKELDENWIAGMMLGSKTTNINITGSSAKAKINSIIWDPFASFSKDNWHIDGAFTIIQNDYALERQDSLGNKLKGNPHGMDWSAYLGISYDIHLDNRVPGLTLTPAFSILYYNSEINGFKEKGKSPQATKTSFIKSHQTTMRGGAELTYLLPDLKTPTEISTSFGLQRQIMNGQSSNYRYYQRPGEHALDNPYTTPGIHDSSIYYGISITRWVSYASNLKIDVSGNLGKQSQSSSIWFSYQKKF